MAHTDVIVLGAGIVGTCCAVHLAKRGLSVALVDRARWARRPPTATPASSRATPSFRRRFRRIGARSLRVALKRSPQANYHLALSAAARAVARRFRAASRPARLIETARGDAAAVRARGRRA